MQSDLGFDIEKEVPLSDTQKLAINKLYGLEEKLSHLEKAVADIENANKIDVVIDGVAFSAIDMKTYGDVSIGGLYETVQLDREEKKLCDYLTKKYGDRVLNTDEVKIETQMSEKQVLNAHNLFYEREVLPSLRFFHIETVATIILMLNESDNV